MDDATPMPMWFYWGHNVNIFFEAWKVQNWFQLILSGIFVSLLAILYEFVNSYKQRLTERFQLIVKENDVRCRFYLAFFFERKIFSF